MIGPPRAVYSHLVCCSNAHLRSFYVHDSLTFIRRYSTYFCLFKTNQRFDQRTDFFTGLALHIIRGRASSSCNPPISQSLLVMKDYFMNNFQSLNLCLHLLLDILSHQCPGEHRHCRRLWKKRDLHLRKRNSSERMR